MTCCIFYSCIFYILSVSFVCLFIFCYKKAHNNEVVNTQNLGTTLQDCTMYESEDLAEPVAQPPELPNSATTTEAKNEIRGWQCLEDTFPVYNVAKSVVTVA